VFEGIEVAWRLVSRTLCQRLLLELRTLASHHWHKLTTRKTKLIIFIIYQQNSPSANDMEKQNNKKTEVN